MKIRELFVSEGIIPVGSTSNPLQQDGVAKTNVPPAKLSGSSSTPTATTAPAQIIGQPVAAGQLGATTAAPVGQPATTSAAPVGQQPVAMADINQIASQIAVLKQKQLQMQQQAQKQPQQQAQQPQA